MTPQECRDEAAACEKKAALAFNPQIRASLLDMARAWRDLANEREDRRGGLPSARAWQRT